MKVTAPDGAKGALINFGTWQSAIYGFAMSHELKELRKKLFPERLPPLKPKLAARGVLHHSKLVKFLSFTLLFNYFDSVFLLSTSKFVKRPSEVKRVLFVLGRQLVLHFSGVRSNRHDEDREVEVRKGKEEAGSDPGNIFFPFHSTFFQPKYVRFLLGYV